MPDIAATEPRIRVDVLLDDADRRAALHEATFGSLRRQPKELPVAWLYDERGSQLFEQITRLPEYYLTRCEREILVARAGEISSRSEAQMLVELGSGTSEKTRLLLDALAAAGTLRCFVPFDASEEVLRASAQAVADQYAMIGVHAIVGDFEHYLRALPAGENRLIAFLGSTIGNLYPDRRRDLLAAVGATLAPGDAFLLGVDLVKDPALIEAAYNDVQGVTETFVRNALTAVNRELRADFDQQRFAFEARWDAEHEWMDVGVRALEEHAVQIDELELEVRFAASEPLRMEVSTKFRRDNVERELAAAGLRLAGWWTDATGGFALLLATRPGTRIL
jgi:L-histidine Nalpha-methyltransferase